MSDKLRLALVFVAAAVLAAAASVLADAAINGITPFRLGETIEESVRPGTGHCHEAGGESMTVCVVRKVRDGRGNTQVPFVCSGGQPFCPYFTAYLWFETNRLVTIEMVFEHRGPALGDRIIAYDVAGMFAGMKAVFDQHYGPAVSDLGTTVVYRDVEGNTLTLIRSDHLTVIVQAPMTLR